MVSTTPQITTQNSNKKLRMRLHIAAILSLVLLLIAAQWGSSTLREVENRLQEKYAQTFVIGTANGEAHKKIATLDGRLFEAPHLLTDSEIIQIKDTILKEIDADRPAYIVARYIEVFLEADNLYNEDLAKNKEWELFRVDLQSAVQKNRDKWLNEIEQSKLSLRTETDVPWAAQQIRRVIKHIPGGIDLDASHVKIEESILYLLNHAQNTLSTAV